ncbi:hypothetical protein R1flu_022218 [Riccia fluitans]|uniref:Myb-like domain-containing protein n=1 Tax=Riccia fluitans TaxID=41844 RepID=A0ABD1ZRL2_9MARC
MSSQRKNLYKGKKKVEGNNEQPAKEKNLETTYTDFKIEYKKHQRPNQTVSSTDSDYVKNFMEEMETVCYKVHNVVNKRGRVTESYVIDRCSWRSKEIEQLIVMRCSQSDLFEKALKTNCSDSSSFWEDIAKQLPRGSGGPEESTNSKTTKECMWLWNMLLREYTSVLGKTKEEEDFPFFHFFHNAWKYIHQAEVPKP